MTHKATMPLEDPLKAWTAAMAEEYKDSKPDCTFLRNALWMPDSGFPRPKFDILEIGGEGKCQCKKCLKFRDKMDEIILKAFDKT